MGILFRAGGDLKKWASSLILQMGPSDGLRRREASGSGTRRSCIRFSLPLEGVPGVDGDPPDGKWVPHQPRS